MPDPTSLNSSLCICVCALELFIYLFIFVSPPPHPLIHSCTHPFSPPLLLHCTGAGMLCTSSTICLLWLLFDLPTNHLAFRPHLTVYCHTRAPQTLCSGVSLAPAHSRGILLRFYFSRTTSPLVSSQPQTEKCKAAVRSGDGDEAGFEAEAHCCAVTEWCCAAAAAQRDPRSVRRCTAAQRAVITGTQTRGLSCTAPTIRLRWHLNNELSLPPPPTPTPQFEARLSDPVTLAHIEH